MTKEEFHSSQFKINKYRMLGASLDEVDSAIMEIEKMQSVCAVQTIKTYSVLNLVTMCEVSDNKYREKFKEDVLKSLMEIKEQLEFEIEML